MMEFINEHAEWLANVVTVLGGVAAMFGYMMHSLRKEFNTRFDSIDKRFEQVEKRFDQMEKRFEQMERRLDRIEDIMWSRSFHLDHREIKEE